MSTELLYEMLSVPQWLYRTPIWYRSVAFPSRLNAELKVHYKSENIVVSEKEAGLVCQSATEPNHLDFLKNKLFDRQQSKLRVYPMHRLDQCTSGLICHSLNQKTARELARILEKRSNDVEKQYLALVWGHLDERRIGEWFSVDRPLVRLNAYSSYVRVTNSADDGVGKVKKSLSKMKVIEFGEYDGEPATKLLIRLETGRRHQIRVHCLSIGHPIIGDLIYNNDHTMITQLLSKE